MGLFVKLKAGGDHTNLNAAPPLTDADGNPKANDDTELSSVVVGAAVGVGTNPGPKPVGLFAEAELGFEYFNSFANPLDSYTPPTLTDCGVFANGDTECYDLGHAMDGSSQLSGFTLPGLAVRGGVRLGPVKVGVGAELDYRMYLQGDDAKKDDGSHAPVSRKDQDGNDIPSKDQVALNNTFFPVALSVSAEFLSDKARANQGGFAAELDLRYSGLGTTSAYDDGDQIGPIELPGTENLQVAGAVRYYFPVKGASNADGLSDAQMEALRARAEKDEQKELDSLLAAEAKKQGITVTQLLAKCELKSASVSVTTETVHGQSGEPIDMRAYGEPSLTFYKYYYVVDTNDITSHPEAAVSGKSVTEAELIKILSCEDCSAE